MAPTARQGDFLPLPVPQDCRLSGLGSRASSRRSYPQFRIHARVTETIEALKCLAGCSTGSEWPLQALNAAQATTLRRIRRLHSQRQCVSAPPPEAALRRLLRQNVATQYAAVGSPASFREDMVSLPPGPGQPCHRVDVLPGTLREVLDNFVDAMLLPQAKRDALADLF